MHVCRRQILGAGFGGLFALAWRRKLDAFFSIGKSHSKRCIVLWMSGGPSQLETFDPKPGTRNGGECRAIPTAVPGTHIAETLPEVARHLDKLSIIRNLTSKEGDHDRGHYYLHTGFTPVPSFPRPTLGSVVSKHVEDSDIPRFVTLGGSSIGPAFMGPDHAPFAISDPEQARFLLEEVRRRRNRLALLNQLGDVSPVKSETAMVARRNAMFQRIERLVGTRFVDALDIERESDSVRQKYGEDDFGRRCLLARRLIESGVHFVEVELGGWDTHADNFRSVKELCGPLDRAWSALMEDLSSSGLLEETMVVWMGEFGRTPNINGQNGRDHFPDVTPVVVGGGGIQGGRVIGQTSADGSSIEGPSYRVADLFATLLHPFGVSPDAEFRTDFDSPTSATDDGKVIKDLL